MPLPRGGNLLDRLHLQDQPCGRAGDPPGERLAIAEREEDRGRRVVEGEIEQRGLSLERPGDEADPDPRELTRRFAAVESRFARRLSQADHDETPPSAMPAALAGMLAATARGIMLRARADASRRALQEIAATTVALLRQPPVAAGPARAPVRC